METSQNSKINIVFMPEAVDVFPQMSLDEPRCLKLRALVSCHHAIGRLISPTPTYVHAAHTCTFTQKTHTWRRDLDVCVRLAVAYFAYLRWAVTVPHGGGYTAPTGPAALPPHGPGPPASVLALRPGTERHALALVAPLGGKKHTEKRRRDAGCGHCVKVS